MLWHAMAYFFHIIEMITCAFVIGCSSEVMSGSSHRDRDRARGAVSWTRESLQRVQRKKHFREEDCC
jgi:hypothetical protein